MLTVGEEEEIEHFSLPGLSVYPCRLPGVSVPGQLRLHLVVAVWIGGLHDSLRRLPCPSESLLTLPWI